MQGRGLREVRGRNTSAVGRTGHDLVRARIRGESTINLGYMLGLSVWAEPGWLVMSGLHLAHYIYSQQRSHSPSQEVTNQTIISVQYNSTAESQTYYSSPVLLRKDR